jgi:hypothetical protein
MVSSLGFAIIWCWSILMFILILASWALLVDW